jgi:tyrosine aminotransferase
LGWVVVYDRHGALADVRDGFYRLSQLILGANSLIQRAIPRILTPEQGSADERSLTAHREATIELLETNARFTFERLRTVPGLEPITPQGAMYVMVRVDADSFDDTINSGMDFVQALLDEEAVFVLPGKCFGVDSFFRIVFTAPIEVLRQAYDSIETFCTRHAKKV